MPERFLKVPHIRQKSDADCLVACTAMLLEFAEFRADYTQLYRVLGTSELGTPHSRIQRLSQLYSDLLLTYRSGDLEDVVACLESGYPVALFVNAKDLPYWGETSGHAIVVVGYADQHFYINDPKFDIAPQIVTQGDIDLAWEAFDYFFAIVQRKPKPK